MLSLRLFYIFGLFYAVFSTNLAPAIADELVTDDATRSAFQNSINSAGFTCPEIATVTRMDSEDTHGRLFIAVCRGQVYRHEYKVSVNPKGYTFVRPRW